MSVALMAARATHDRPGGWTPDDLATLDLWLDADDAKTITVATGVSQWNDKSGNGRNVSQSSGAFQPAYVTGARNGRAVVRFTGASDHKLIGSDQLDLGTGGISGVIAMRNNLAGTANFVLTKQAGAVNTDGQWRFDVDAMIVRLGGVQAAPALTRTAALKLNSYVIDRSGGAYVWRNGSDTASVTASPFPNTTSVNTAINFVVGGREANPGNAYTGDICEIVVSMATWTTSERQTVEGYLAHKWGMAGDLPSNHPYKDKAP